MKYLCVSKKHEKTEKGMGILNKIMNCIMPVQMFQHWSNVLAPLGSSDYPGSMILEPLQFSHCVMVYA